MEKVSLENYPDTLTIEQASECLGFGRTKMFELIKYNVISSIKVGRIRYITKSAIIDFLKRSEQ